MQIRHDPNAPKPVKHKFADVKGHRSLVDVDAIKKGNEDRKRERLLKSVGDSVNALGDDRPRTPCQRKAGQILATEGVVMPKTNSIVQSKFQVNNNRVSDFLPVRVITIDSDAKLGTNAFDDAVQKAATEMKMKEQKEMEDETCMDS